MPLAFEHYWHPSLPYPISTLECRITVTHCWCNVSLAFLPFNAIQQAGWMYVNNLRYQTVIYLTSFYQFYNTCPFCCRYSFYLCGFIHYHRSILSKRSVTSGIPVLMRQTSQMYQNLCLNIHSLMFTRKKYLHPVIRYMAAVCQAESITISAKNMASR